MFKRGAFLTVGKLPSQFRHASGTEVLEEEIAPGTDDSQGSGICRGDGQTVCAEGAHTRLNDGVSYSRNLAELRL
jgi:hypothetical protein